MGDLSTLGSVISDIMIEAEVFRYVLRTLEIGQDCNSVDTYEPQKIMTYLGRSQRNCSSHSDRVTLIKVVLTSARSNDFPQ